MMKKNCQKAFLSVLFLGVFFFGVKSSEASTCTPTITGTKNIKENSLSLKVACSQLEGKRVNIKVRIENTDSDSISTKTYGITLDDGGAGSFKISELDSGTLYNFKLKIKKSSSSSYSAYSNSIGATTKGAKYTPKISGTKSIKSNSIVLKTACSKLKKKKVNIQVRVENKDDDAVSTKTYGVTLDKNGKYNLKIEDLDSGTEYGFKIKIKKTTDSAYSVYSNEKTTQTKS